MGDISQTMIFMEYISISSVHQLVIYFPAPLLLVHTESVRSSPEKQNCYDAQRDRDVQEEIYYGNRLVIMEDMIS